jgi:hypothetical protein
MDARFVEQGNIVSVLSDRVNDITSNVLCRRVGYRGCLLNGSSTKFLKQKISGMKKNMNDIREQFRLLKVDFYRIVKRAIN